TNIAAVFLAYQAAGIVLRDNISYTANLGIFLFLVAVISWLYQKSLDKANERLLQMGMIQRDLEIASEVQKRLFPDTPQLQNNACLNGYVQPARETSGDFYDFIHLGADEMGILVADVTGKSMAAALMMTMTRSILRNEASSATSPAQVLAQANQTLLSDTAIEQMVTVWYGVFNTRTYVFRYSNAGHPFALLKRQGRVEELQLSGFPLGAIKEAVYNNQMTRLEPDDTLILFSDGIPEAMNPQNEMFGFDRLQEALRHAKGSRPEQIKEAIWQSVIAFQQGAEQLDDMTLVVIHIDGKDA
ncbi:MAG TPA: PP2C family protein-serine/threonine phosphatase, partial [Chloroflexi bacterium]|nr:PP2C family protein-serine/threonine phosphatase [Chloroflexota bacterium]